jgi:ubiquinone/menaquinone biosynthesis C-methylase UbiE/uncharacterized protein YbaR (Trm112 family)
VEFVCPRCKGELRGAPEAWRCEKCARSYPIVCGIPDFRLAPDPYISIEADREKGALLWEAAQSRSFEELLRHYYAITKEDPPDLAARWIAHALAEISIAEFALREAGFVSTSPPAALLDIGCSTGAMLIAASSRAREVVGVDVAFRWLVVAKARLRDAGVPGVLVCANAEALPFPGASFDLITAQDTIEHLGDAPASIAECHRVARPQSWTLWTTNNRYAPLPEPHVRMWGVGYLPRRWQAGYVAFRRKDLHHYAIRLRSAAEMSGLFRGAGYAEPITRAAPLFAPHWNQGSLQHMLAAYNRVRKVPLIAELAALAGPRLWTLARR